MGQWQIVVIEDNPADVFLVQLALESNDVACEMTTFENGQEALKVLCPAGETGSNALVPDAILLDLNTPKSDGFDVLNEIRKSPRLSHTPVAILTSSQATSDKGRASRMGVRYIEKPSHLEAFLSTVGNAVKDMLAQKAPRPAA